MKKILLVAIVACAFSSSANAVWVEGTVDSINTYPAGTSISITKTAGGQVTQNIRTDQYQNPSDAHKQIIAVALTAKSTGAIVKLNKFGGWNSIILK